MNPILITGAEHGLPTLSASGLGLCASVTAGVSVQSSVKRTGSYAFKFTASASNPYFNWTCASSTVVVASFYIRFESWPAAIVSIFSTCPAGSDTVIGINTDHKLYVKSNNDSGAGQVMATALSLDTWYLIDVRMTTSGGNVTIDWAVGGAAQTQYVYAYASPAWTTLNIGLHTPNVVTAVMYMDDLIISITSGDYAIGAHEVVGLRPNAAGTSSPNPATKIYDNGGTLVNDSSNPANVELSKDPFSSTLGSYIKQTTTGTSDYVEVNFADIGASVSSVLGVWALLQYQSSGTSTNNGKAYIYTEDGDFDTIFSGDMSDISMFYKSVIIHAPNGGWDKDAVSALKGRVGYSDDINPVPYWTALILEAAYVLQTSTPISITDSGSGSDAAPTIKTKFTMADAGIGAEAILGVFQKWISESGVGGESLGLNNAFMLSDAGLGTEAVASLIKAAMSDSGIGTDSPGLTVKFSIADTGVGNDVLALIRALLGLADSGVGSEIVTAGGQMTPINISDLGAGADIPGIKALVPVLESGSGAEIIGLKALIPILESGVGADAAGLKMAFMIPDTGAGTDTVLLKLFKALADSGYGIEQVITTSPTKFISDSGQGIDVLIVLGTGGRKPSRVPPRAVIVLPVRR